MEECSSQLNNCFEFPSSPVTPINAIPFESTGNLPITHNEISTPSKTDSINVVLEKAENTQDGDQFSDFIDDLMFEEIKMIEPAKMEQQIHSLEVYLNNIDDSKSHGELPIDLDVCKTDCEEFIDYIANCEEPEFGNEQAGNLTVEDVHAIINENCNKTEYQKVEAVNSCFNRVNYYSDIDHWGRDDYWATPFEFVNSGGGDCEDYALAKYITLKEMGIAEDKLFVTYASCQGVAHMVLMYYPTPSSSPLVLDNVNKELLPFNQRNDLSIIYSINRDGIWRPTNNSIIGNRIGHANDLNSWVNFNNKLNAEGNKLFWDLT